MFVTMKKIALATILTSLTISTTVAQAGEAGTLTVNLKDVQPGGGPLYVSVQKREDFMQDRGTSGGIYKEVKGGDTTYIYSDVPAGEYSIMIWHDLDNDDEFTMSEQYFPLDGWGMSGPSINRMPTFDDAKTSIGSSGTEITITMQYPE